MGSRPLTETERDFAETLATALRTLASVQEKASEVVQSGGDCKRAFLSIVADDERPMVEMQWPMIAMMLGA